MCCYCVQCNVDICLISVHEWMERCCQKVEGCGDGSTLRSASIIVLAFHPGCVCMSVHVCVCGGVVYECVCVFICFMLKFPQLVYIILKDSML